MQIEALHPELANRITTTITAASNGHETGERLHLQAIYDEERATMKLILSGGVGRVAETLKLIEVLLESS